MWIWTKEVVHWCIVWIPTLKVSFDVRKCVLVNNRVEFVGQVYDFKTELKFSKNAAVVVQMCSHQTGKLKIEIRIDILKLNK